MWRGPARGRSEIIPAIDPCDQPAVTGVGSLPAFDGQLTQRVVVRFEAVAINIHEDRVRDGDGQIVRVLRAHHRAELRPLADRRHDNVGIALEVDRDFLVELQRRVREPVWGATGA